MQPTIGRHPGTGWRYGVAALKRDHPLTQVLPQSGIRLRRLGPTTDMAHCPFHDDRRPSLLVDGRDQHYHCFGCRAHGDVFLFLHRRYGLTFLEAHGYLAGLPPCPPPTSPRHPTGRAASGAGSA